MPKLFKKQGHVYTLKKSLYGLQQAPINFVNTLREGLEAIGLKQSKIDLWLFALNNVICLFYVDDCLFFSRSVDKMDKVIKDLKHSFSLSEEDLVAGFVGILLEKQ